MSDIPSDCRYTKDHEWARKDADLVIIGITAHAVEALGDITMLTLPEPGTTLSRGEAFGDVDSVKAVSELFCPIDGEVIARNDDLEEAPERVNEDPYAAGWLIKIKPTDPAQLEALLDATAYAALIAEP